MQLHDFLLLFIGYALGVFTLGIFVAGAER